MIDLSSFDVIEYLQEAGISYTESGKNVSRDWIGISCPYCGDQSNHCGINIKSKVFSCFRCGEKGRITKLIMELENQPFAGAIKTVQKFTKKDKYGYRELEQKGIAGNAMVEQLISDTTTPLCPRDRDYLVSRKFDASSLSTNYGLLSCKPTSKYTQRILIPYIRRGKIQTFSTRDVSGKAKVKYLHCPVEQSVAPPKELLFNIDQAKDVAIVVEGVFDVFRLGKGSVALSGTQYTRRQVLLLSQFKRLFFLFDPEPKAQDTALKLANDLSFCSGSIEVILLKGIDCDPGDMKEDDVKCLRKEVFGRIY